MDVAINPLDDASARRSGPSDAQELARLRWIWRAMERTEKGDPDRFRTEFRPGSSNASTPIFRISSRWEVAL